MVLGKTQGRIQDFGKCGKSPTLDDFEMSRRRRRGNAEGVAGGECEKGLNPPLTGGPPPKFFQNLGAFSCTLGIPQLYFQAT